MSTEPNSQERPRPPLHVRERQRSAQALSGQTDPNLEARRQWLNELESQRQHLFDALYELTDFDQAQYQRAIKAAQEEGEEDEEGISRASWTVENPEDLVGLIQRNTWACLRQVARLDLAIKQLEEQFHAATKYQTAPESLRHLLLLPTKVEQSASSLLAIMARGHQLLGAIRILQNRENFLRDRRRGSAGSNRKPKKTETQHLITAMTKMLYQAEPPQNARANELELTRHYVERILEIWSVWPFFHLDAQELINQVGQAVQELGLPLEKKKVLYKRRKRTLLAQPRRNQDSLYITEKESFARECEARQVGITDALVQVMEAKFGPLEDQHKVVIGQASPEQVSVWLRCVHDASSTYDLLSMAEPRVKR